MAVQPAADGVQLPEQFGHYRIVKRLGQGGMGTVYLALDQRLNRRVALKVCHIAANHPQALERFRREAQAAASLRHANLCPIYEYGEQDGIHYFTMAHIEGQSLGHWLARRPPLSQREAALLVRKLALAMQEAHAGGVIHRDLKPANIMLERGEPIILDFGLAGQAQSQGDRLTKLGAVLGTLSYMSPEQIGGDPAQVGPGCDIYSLGVILYELLTGRVPFEGPPMSVMGQLLHTAPKPPRVVRADIDPRLEAACLKSLAKKPAERFPSMADFARVMSECVRALPEGAKPAATKLAPAPVAAATQFVPPPSTLSAVSEAATIPLDASELPRRQRSRRRQSSKRPHRPWLAISIGAVVGLALLGTIIGIVRALKSDANRPATVEREKQDEERKGSQPSKSTENEKKAAIALLLKKGKEALDDDRYPDALLAFDDALKLDPTNIEAQIGLKRSWTAVTVTKDTEKKKQQQAEYARLMIDAKKAWDARQYAGAAQLFDAALKVMPGDPEATNALAEANALLAKDRAEKLAEMQRLLALGRNARAKQHYIEASLAFEAALKLVPDDREAQDRLKETTDALMKAKVDHAFLMLQGDNALKLQRLDEALKNYQAAALILPEDPAALRAIRIVNGRGKSSVVMETSMGTIIIELFPDKAPGTVKNFLQYVDDQYYDSTIFHRVIDNFMIQGGGYVAGMKEKKTREAIKNESDNGLSNMRGTLAMARTPAPDSATAQFFINVKDNAFLDRANSKDNAGYCVFGKVIEGMDVIDKIKLVKIGNRDGHASVPEQDVVIKSVRRASQ